MDVENSFSVSEQKETLSNSDNLITPLSLIQAMQEQEVEQREKQERELLPVLKTSAFPDPSEDLFWQKTKSADVNDDKVENLDATWNPTKQNKIDLKEGNIDAALPPPPPPINNTNTRHSRKSSRVNWNLRTESEKHIELLETKLKNVMKNDNNLKSPTAIDFGGTALATLGYHPEESTTIATALSATIDPSPNGDLINNDEDDENYPETTTDIPQESDEGLWLLWRNNTTEIISPPPVNNHGEGGIKGFLLPFLSRTSITLANEPGNNDNPNENDRLYFYGNRNDDELFEGEGDVDEFLLGNARRKLENEYLWGGWWWSATRVFGCNVCGPEDD